MNPDEITIEDFIVHRWVDAKEALRERDPEFVGWSENTVGLSRIGLTTPWSVDGRETPKKPLPKEWHRLLEACVELVLQRTCLQVAAEGLHNGNNSKLSILEAGKSQSYHVRSWVIHADTIAERTNDVIQKTSDLYVTDPYQAGEVAKRHKASVKKTLTAHVRASRNEYAHGTTRSWSQALTKERHWERAVAIGVTPKDFLDEYFYSPQGQKTIDGTYYFIAPLTTEMVRNLGMILHHLEEDLMTERKLKYRMERYE